jgi:membrane protein required for colicin V production
MTALDILFLLAVGLGLVFGFMRGFVKEVLSLGIWVLAIVALRLLHAPVSASLEGVVGTVSGAYVLAFALIAMVVIVGGKLVVRQLSGSIKRSAIGPLDRILGGGFGALKGLVGVALLYMAFSLVYDTIWGRAAVRPLWIANAMTYPLVHSSSSAIVDLVEARRGRAAEFHGNAPAEDEPAREK